MQASNSKTSGPLRAVARRWQASGLAVAAALSLASGGAQAAVFTSVACAPTSWTNAGCWSPSGVPGAADTARVASEFSNTVVAVNVTRVEVLPNATLGVANGTSPTQFTAATAEISGLLALGIGSTFSSTALTVIRAGGALATFNVGTSQVLLGDGGLLNHGTMVLNSVQVIGSAGANLVNSARIEVRDATTFALPQFSQGGSLLIRSSQLLTVNSPNWSNDGTITLQPATGAAPATVVQGDSTLRHMGGLLTGGGRVLNAITATDGSIRPAAGAVLSLEGAVEFQRPASVQVDGTSGTLLQFKNDVRFGGSNFHTFTGTGNTRFGGEVQLGPDVPVGVRLQLDGRGTLQNTSNLVMRLGAGGMSDSFVSLGGLALEGGRLTFTSIDGEALAIGSSFTLFPQTLLSGTFANIDAAEVPLAAGAVLDFSSLYVDGTLRVVAVPEPATWLLLGAGLLGMALRRRALGPA